ncbi:hypothetical protein ACFW08_33830 [Streptomyces sp. NPDC058960]|uniref:hypothetical protein n=1 Tax=Streptomyces sp. NPDC058960 TaxID=3346679 RepID=UPI0036911445
MNPESIANAAATVVTSLGTFIGIASRRKRWRSEIRENLSLAEELEKNALIRDHTPALAWLHGKITLDVAKLSGQPLGTPKKPIPWGSVAFSFIVALAFGYWTYYLDEEGFVWYSIFPGAVAALLLISIMGSFVNREIPPESGNEFPEGAVPVRSNDASEQISRAVAVASMGSNDRYDEDGQLGVAFRFAAHVMAGDFDAAADLVDVNWLRCRIQAWLWNNEDEFGRDHDSLAVLAEAVLLKRNDHALWGDFTSSEIATFQEGWAYLDPETLGGASRRRRVARDYDLVVLAPVGESGGYYVNSATIVPGALTFLMRRYEGRWLLASHLTSAPPAPGFPPVWWVVGDPSVEALED